MAIVLSLELSSALKKLQPLPAAPASETAFTESQLRDAYLNRPIDIYRQLNEKHPYRREASDKTHIYKINLYKDKLRNWGNATYQSALRRVLQDLETQLTADLAALKIQGYLEKHPKYAVVEQHRQEIRQELSALDESPTSPSKPTTAQLLEMIPILLSPLIPLGLAFFLHRKAHAKQRAQNA